MCKVLRGSHTSQSADNKVEGKKHKHKLERAVVASLPIAVCKSHKSWLRSVNKKGQMMVTPRPCHVVQSGLIMPSQLLESLQLTSCPNLYCLSCAHLNFKRLEYSDNFILASKYHLPHISLPFLCEGEFARIRRTQEMQVGGYGSRCHDRVCETETSTG